MKPSDYFDEQMEHADPYDNFINYMTYIVQRFSVNSYVQCYNELYLNKGLMTAPEDVRNETINEICKMPYSDIIFTFQLKELPRLSQIKLLRIISTIRNKCQSTDQDAA